MALQTVRVCDRCFSAENVGPVEMPVLGHEVKVDLCPLCVEIVAATVSAVLGELWPSEPQPEATPRGKRQRPGRATVAINPVESPTEAEAEAEPPESQSEPLTVKPRRLRSSRLASAEVDAPTSAQVRRWAEENGHPVPARGRVPAAVTAAYLSENR